LGSLNTDLVSVTPRVPLAGETLTSTSFVTVPGGKGLNQCISTQRLSRTSANAPSDIHVRMIGAVGSDTFGPMLRSTLTDNGVTDESIKTADVNSGVAVIIVEETDGMNRILISPGANGTVTWDDKELEREGEQVGMLVAQLETPMETVLAAVGAAHSRGMDVLLNPAPAKTLPMDVYPKIKYLIVNETEAAILGEVDVKVLDTDTGIQSTGYKLKSFGAKNVVITLGSRGCWWTSEDGKEGFVPVEKVSKVVDTTGAGDTWVGAFAVAVTEGREMGEAARLAGKAAGVAVTKAGAIAGIPWRGEV
ncbi:Ribokinase-like protein, partial [Ascobolus immersus RN42]